MTDAAGRCKTRHPRPSLYMRKRKTNKKTRNKTGPHKTRREREKFMSDVQFHEDGISGG